MQLRQSYNLIFLSGLLLLLSACDISTSDGGPPITTSTINAFDVAGNVDSDERIVLQMFPNNATSSGSFHLFWDVESSDPYTIETYISSNTALDDTDGLFLRMQCGSEVLSYICQQSGHISCAIAYQPDYVLCGHLHDNAGKKDKIGKSLVINPGWEGMMLEI